MKTLDANQSLGISWAMTSTILKYEQKASLKSCPSCGSKEIAKSRLRGFEGVLVFLSGYRPYRCIPCYERNWIKKNQIQTIVFGLLLMLIAANISYLMLIANQAAVDYAFSGSDSNYSVQPRETIHRAQVMDFDGVGNSLMDENHHDRQRVVKTYLDSGDASKALSKAAPFPSGKSNANFKTGYQRSETTKSAVAKQRSISNKYAFLYRESIKKEIAIAVKVWRDAWQSGNISKYLDSYSHEFLPEGQLSFQEWKQNRIKILNRRIPQKIAITGSKLTSLSVDSAELVFIQEYQSEDYNDTVVKKLWLAKNDDGWKLTREREIKRVRVF